MTDTPPDRLEAGVLEELAPRFLAALRSKEAGQLDHAEDELRAILKIEPRLAEAQLELGRICLDTDRLDEAETRSREGLRLLKSGGQWTDDLPEEVVQSVAHALLAEVLRRKADEDDVIFGDPDAYRALLRDSQAHFAKASELDPSDETSSYHAFFMGVGDAGSERNR